MIRPRTTNFRGLNTVTDPERGGLEWLVQADNIDITNRGAVVRCRGYTRASTNTALTGAYATADLRRLYLVDNGDLLQMDEALNGVVLRSGLGAGEMSFEEVNGVVYYSNGADFGIIEETGARPWGITPPGPPVLALASGSLTAGTYLVLCSLVDDRGMESGNSVPVAITVPDGAGISISSIPQVSGYTTNVYATTCDGTVFMLLYEGAPSGISYNSGPDTLGREFEFWNMEGPRGEIPALFQGEMHLAEAFVQLDLSVVWRSQPLAYHHFDHGSDAFSVPGSVRMLDATPDGKYLMVGTDRGVYAWDGERLELVAPYGVVPGWHASGFGDKLYFWSVRGLCAAMPFANLTQATISVPPGLSAGATVMEKDGMRRYVVALHKGGEAFNTRE